MKWVAVRTLNALLEKKTGYVFKTRLAQRIQLEGGSDGFELAAINDDRFRADIIQVSDRCSSGEIPVPRFLPQSSARIGTQITNKLIGHAKLDGHHQDVIGRAIAFVGHEDMLDHPLLEQPTYLAAIYRITSKTIQFPTDNTFGLTLRYTPEHIIEHRTAGHLGGLLLDQFLGYLNMLVSC